MQLISDFSRVHWLKANEPLARFSLYEIKAGFEGVRLRGVAPYHRVKQVHGTEIVEASLDTSPDSQRLPQGDGIITRHRGTPVAVRTADCLPILMADQKRQMAMAVHAGWRGLSPGILGSAFKKYSALGGDSEQLLMAVGPAISPSRYEVGPEVVGAFDLQKLEISEAQFMHSLCRGRGDRWYLDLASMAVCMGLNFGLDPSNIHVIRSCTYENPELWYSFRRQGKEMGSNWSWIMI